MRDTGTRRTRAGRWAATEAFAAGYRADGLRAWKSFDGVRTYFLYDGDGRAEVELNGSGAPSAVNLYDPEGLVGRMDGSGTRYYQFDPQGNVSHTTDAGGNLIDSRAYDAYGRELAVKNAAGAYVSAGDPFGHDAKWGYYYDREVGWYHTDNRTYDPATARWLERDPIGFAGGVNPYLYCGGNPVGSADPTGLYVAFKGGTLAARLAILAALNNVSKTAKGKTWANEVIYGPLEYTITIGPKSEGSPTFREVGIRVGDLNEVQYETEDGKYEYYTWEHILAHEFGHHFGKLGRDLKDEDEVVKGWENPVARQLGQPTRGPYLGDKEVPKKKRRKIPFPKSLEPVAGKSTPI